MNALPLMKRRCGHSLVKMRNEVMAQPVRARATLEGPEPVPSQIYIYTLYRIKVY